MKTGHFTPVVTLDQQVATEALFKENKIKEEVQLLPTQKIPLYREEYVNQAAAKQQAKEWWDDYILPSLIAGKPVALLYSANQKQAESLYQSYERLNISLSDIFVDTLDQAELFREIARLIEQYHCRDRVHILPIPTPPYSGDNKKPYHQVSLGHINKALENVVKHRGAGFEIMSQGDHANEALKVIMAESTAEWGVEWYTAFVAGINEKKHLSIFKNVDPSILEKLSDSDSQGMKQILGLVYDYQANRLSKKNDGTIQSVDLVNREATWSQIVRICKEHTSILGGFSKYNRLQKGGKRTPEVDLIYRAIAEFDANLRWWPEINNLEELVIAQQKRDAVNHYFKKEYIRLTGPEGASLFDSNPTQKLAAYEQLTEAMMSSDKRMMLSSILKENSVAMMQPVIMKANDNKGIKLTDESDQVITIQDALYQNRSIFNASQATSKTKLDELRDEVAKVNPRTILNFSHSKSEKITNIQVMTTHSAREDDVKLAERDTTFAKYQYLINQHSQKLSEETIYHLNHPLFFALIEKRNKYLSLHRLTHVEDINKLIQEVSLIIRQSDNYQERTNLILDRIQEIFDQEERHFCQPGLGLFGKGKSKEDFAKKLASDEHDYEYPRMLKNILSNYSQTTQLAVVNII